MYIYIYYTCVHSWPIWQRVISPYHPCQETLGMVYGFGLQKQWILLQQPSLKVYLMILGYHRVISPFWYILVGLS